MSDGGQEGSEEEDRNFRITLAVLWEINWMEQLKQGVQWEDCSIVQVENEIWTKVVAGEREKSMDSRNIKGMKLKGFTNSVNNV